MLIIKENIPLSQYTTFKIGGAAKYFTDVSQKNDLVEAVNWAESRKIPYFILGGGSNLLVSDTGFPGLIIHLINDSLAINGQEITVGAGLALSKLVTQANNHELAGLVWASGIPGTVGGATRGNAGAYGGEIKDNVKAVEYYDTNSKDFHLINNTDCQFNYRSSIFKSSDTKIIWEIKFSLSPSDQETLSASSQDIIQLRNKNLPTQPSAGCIFTNLIINELKTPSMPLQNIINQTNIKGGKLGCGVIIDNLDLKGTMIGGASISCDHANFIINQNNAKASDVTSLIKLIKEKVHEKIGLKLEEEISLLGF